MSWRRSSAPSAVGSPAPRRPRWPYQGKAQQLLLLGTVPVIVGSFLPWVETGLLTFKGTAGPGLWTLCAGVIGLAGGMLRGRVTVLVHAAAVAVVALGLPTWQIVRILRLVGPGGWLPGAGMLLVAVGGVTCAVAAARLARSPTR